MWVDDLKSAKILVVDDVEANVLVLTRMLGQAGFGEVSSTMDPREVATIYSQSRLDLMILDLHMPHMDGFEVMEELSKSIPEGTYFPILVITADTTPEAMRRALSMGARDVLTKPFDSTEVLLRVGNLLETRSLHLQLQDQNVALERRVAERTQQLEDRLATISELSEHRRELLGRLQGAEYWGSQQGSNKSG